MRPGILIFKSAGAVFNRRGEWVAPNAPRDVDVLARGAGRLEGEGESLTEFQSNRPRADDRRGADVSGDPGAEALGSTAGTLDFERRAPLRHAAEPTRSLVPPGGRRKNR